MEGSIKYILPESELPKKWYNIQADFPGVLPPPYNPREKRPATPDELLAIFPKNLVEQEVTRERWIEIPDEVYEIYKLWRPAPLIRAKRLEKALNTPAKIFYKYEGVSPAGSHKPNTSIPQAYYNKISGVDNLSTETGAGQWGSALALAGTFFDMKITIFMVRISYDQKPFRKTMIQTWGGTIYPSPSNVTEFGKKIIEQMPDTPGSLGIAISEAIEMAVTNKNTNYALGSVLNHVILHQTIVGLECKKQFEALNAYPDIIIGCVGGGSNFGGIAFPFVQDKINKTKNPEIIAVEPFSCPTITRGKYAYDYGDTAKMTPALKMHTLGHSFIPAAIHAGGLRYHGMSPLVSYAKELKLIDAVAYHQVPVFEAAALFSKTEGIIPAPESSHAIRCAIDKAIDCRNRKEEKIILFNLSGHGHFDMASYEKYLNNQLVNYELEQSKIDKSLTELPEVVL
ncbi:TrpB-like pyridoxal phosphate-dependent enzyme [Candidatus Dependentiae bacterium]|nr:TrpB-like pyridoxal phosphate-dependent enzyme [Candidatus Dependentiae bacterium]